VWDGQRYALAIVSGATYVTHVSAELRPLHDNLALAPRDAGLDAMIAMRADGLIAIYLRRAFGPMYGDVHRAFIRTPVPAVQRERRRGSGWRPESTASSAAPAEWTSKAPPNRPARRHRCRSSGCRGRARHRARSCASLDSVECRHAQGRHPPDSLGTSDRRAS